MKVSRAIKGYGQFVQALLPGRGKFTIVPSLVVDEVWHHHIRHGKHYQQMVDMFNLGGGDGAMHHDPGVTVEELLDAPSDYGQTLKAILGAEQDGLDTWAWPEEQPKVGCITLDDDAFTNWGCIVNSQGRKVCSIVSGGTETSTQCRAHCTSEPAGRDTWAWPEEQPKVGCITFDDDIWTSYACDTADGQCKSRRGGSSLEKCRALCVPPAPVATN
jgi:hypothetical protein